MRAPFLPGLAVLAVAIAVPAAAWAWSTEQTSQNADAASRLAEQDDPLKALQDKVNSKNGGSKQSGFYFSAGPSDAQPFSSSGFKTNRDTFGYSPMPGFRGQPQ